MSLDTGNSKLNSALKAMRAHWEETKPVWKDAVRQDFEEHHWSPLEAQVMATLREIDQLAQAITKARQECS